MINILNNALELDFKIPNSVYNDALENGHLHGTVAYNLDGSGKRIAIPIHDASRQTSNTNKGSRVNNTTPKTPVKTSGKNW